MSTPLYTIDEDAIRRAWSLFFEPGQVTELRCLDARIRGEWRSGIYSGYFDNAEAAIENLRRLEAAKACYIMPNPVTPALHARAYNRARIITGKEPTTADHNILARKWLLIDIDAKRDAGISATDAEKAAALETVTGVDCELWEKGFPPGIIGDSGNGYHLMIPCDLPAKDNGYCERFLKDLAARWNNEQAEVDISVHNPARIWKLPGTLVCKGDHCPALGRVWRMSKIRMVCKEVQDA